ncbi:MAG TPA: S8 family serine peptidase [Sphingomicrobium sp.]|nr:S8 family serine peptidase [Sphingomicrobium sp.]
MIAHRLVLWLLGILAAVAAVVSQPALAEPASTPARQILVMVRHPPGHLRPGTSYGGGYDDALAKSARDRLARDIAGQYGLTVVDAWPMPMIGMDCFVMAVPDGRSTQSAADQVSRNGNVAWAEPVEIYHAQSSPASDNDPLFPAQPAARQWQLADLHRMATGRGVKVAIVDSGIQANHPDLAGQVAVNRNFVSGEQLVSESHGTGVAGIIAAKANNGIGIAGVAPGAKLLGLRACWQKPDATVCDSFSLAKALYFAIDQKADVLNLSLSGPDDRLLRMLVKTALDRGTEVVAAFDPNQQDGGFPASVRGVIAVSDAQLATGQSGVYIAPGRDVPTTEPGGRWFLANGSSFAAAHVSGLLALVRQRRPSGAVTIVSDQPRGGTIQACATVLKAAGSCDCSCESTRSGHSAAAR